MDLLCEHDLTEERLVGPDDEALRRISVAPDVLQNVVGGLGTQDAMADVAGQHEAALLLLDPSHVAGPNLEFQVREVGHLTFLLKNCINCWQ